MADPNITEEVHFEMLEKKSDGSFKAKYPKVKSKSGITFDEHLAESTQQAHLAKNIGLEDTSGNFVATEVEGAMLELFTNVSSGKDLVGGAITDVDDSVVIPTDPTFNDLASAIGQISTGKKWASGEFDYGTIPLDTDQPINVTDLPFTPSTIVIKIVMTQGSARYLRVIGGYMEGESILVQNIGGMYTLSNIQPVLGGFNATIRATAGNAHQNNHIISYEVFG